MNNKAILYLHGFNSASSDQSGCILQNKNKLLMLQRFCQQKNVGFFAPNVDYRDFKAVLDSMLLQYRALLKQGCEVVFMGSSLGGFSSEYLAMKTGCPVLMINPAISPATLLTQFVGVAENFETGGPYHWQVPHCLQFQKYQQQLEAFKGYLKRVVFLDMGDELLDASATISHYAGRANVVCFEGGSHGFEHMQQALPIIESVLFE